MDPGTATIAYRKDLEGLAPKDLLGFFEGWPNPPSPETHLRLLRGSQRVAIAIDEARSQVVGFATALTDGVLCAYIPLLEVRADYRGIGIGRTLVECLLEDLSELYMVDLVCDPELVPFYESFGMRRLTAMSLRRYDKQSGRG